MRAAEPFFVRFLTGLRLPRRRILGMEVAGEVEAVGAAVTEFKAGDEVFRRYRRRRARGVRLRTRARALAHKPVGLSFDEGGSGLRRGDHRARGHAGAGPRDGRSIVV